ncbi:MAG: sigma-54-dependent Fis family transcriptional regulator [Paludibacteraceae bacterium]|nr:sigma-54-dependent Fis family transcriptional regulator [Paludibacteraceae bacterium]
MQNAEIQSVKNRFGIIGNSEALNRAIETAVQVAPTDLTVLIQGESGVGKENIAQIIHQYSARKHAPYIAVNCGAIPSGTVDSELFGHEKGAFTDAKNERKGYFEIAEGGTIFLDEVGELPLDVQSKLLRVLENHEYIRVGGSKVMKSNVRVVVATNVNLEQAIADGKFRTDLYYRMNTIPIRMPSLRERKDDINLLFRKFASDFAERYHRPSVKLDAEAQQVLASYPWPGNIRQLKNIAEQISAISGGREISAPMLLEYLPERKSTSYVPTLASAHNAKTFENEREILYQVLFDMKKDMQDLKNLVNEIIQSGNIHIDPSLNFSERSSSILDELKSQEYAPLEHSEYMEPKADGHVTVLNAPQHVGQKHASISSIDEAVVDAGESLSLAEIEKETIRKALEKHHGRRRLAARELGFSERTLYRKIKEYGL